MAICGTNWQNSSSTFLFTALLLLATAVTGILSTDYSAWVENNTSVCVSISVTLPSANGSIPKKYFEVPSNETGEIFVQDVEVTGPLQWQVACIVRGQYVRIGVPVPPEGNVTLSQLTPQTKYVSSQVNSGAVTVALFVNDDFSGYLQSILTQL